MSEWDDHGYGGGMSAGIHSRHCTCESCCPPAAREHQPAQGETALDTLQALPHHPDDCRDPQGHCILDSASQPRRRSQPAKAEPGTPRDGDQPEPERDMAIKMANRALDKPWTDPDDDLHIISRQFLRAIERENRAAPATADAGRLAREIADEFCGGSDAVAEVIEAKLRAAMGQKAADAGLRAPAARLAQMMVRAALGLSAEQANQKGGQQ